MDLEAPGSAVDLFNRATTLLKAQKSQDAIKYLQKAVRVYPKFVAAHNALGLAYQDQSDERTKGEFETAAKLDPKFPGSFLNLGLLPLSVKDFASAESNLATASSMGGSNAKILSALAFAESGNHHYDQALKTAERVHTLEHRGMANIHYIAAAAAVALNDPDRVEQQLNFFLSEDPTNPLAPTAKQNLEILARRKQRPVLTASAAGLGNAATASDARPVQTFPNSDRLKAQLSALGEGPGVAAISAPPDSAGGAPTHAENALPAPALYTPPASTWTIRQTVDETALFFAVSDHGHMVSNLEISNIKILDNNRPPDRVVQFIPQSKLPLRIGLIIDTSGSVEHRFSFEKHAAAKFLEKVLTTTSNLGFVAGFNSDMAVTQDFTASGEDLAKGIDRLANGGGTALFDAVYTACLKLADYPEGERVAKVLVVLSDGEANSSHRSLKQTIEIAETTGVTIYTLSTSEYSGPKTDADKILNALAERSGGEAMFPGDILTFGKSLDRLRDLIRSRYLLAYRPAEFVPNGKYRPIHITAERDGKHLQIHARKGYYARLEANH